MTSPSHREEGFASFVAAFVEEIGEDAPEEAFAFGDSPAMADELLALVLAGRKRATAALLADLDHLGEQVPRPGDTAIVLDGAGSPACVVRTTQVGVGPFHSVDAAFAHDEGEGDRSLEYWIVAHERFFHERAQALGIEFSPDLEVVFERFELLWTPSG